MAANRNLSKLIPIKDGPLVPKIMSYSQPTWTEALMRGAKRMCPRCGKGKMFAGYLTPRESCESCGLAFEPLRADDAPTYFTVFLVGHIAIAGVLFSEQLSHPALWILTAVWIPATLAMMFSFLPIIKGAVMGAIYSSQAGEHKFPAE
jgi:uncharacterized protein (DUF983 family)